MMRLEPHVAMDSSETLFSWLGRLAAIHAGLDLVPFLNDLQIKSREIEIDANGAHERLADLTGVSIGQMAQQHYFSVGDRRLRFRSETFAVEFAPKVHRMVCPLCLEEEGGGDPIRGPRTWKFRLLWTVRYCAACPKHLVGLVSPVHKKVGYVPEHDTARAVGDRLPELISKAAPRPVTPLQRWVTHRMLGDRGDGWLDRQDIDQAAKATEMLGVVLAHGPMPNMNLMTAEDWDRAWEAGFEVTSRGAEAIVAALEGLTLRGRASTRSFTGPQANLGRLYQWLAFNEASGWRAGPIRDLVREHIIDNYNVAAGDVVLSEVVPCRRVHTAVSLHLATGINSRTARNLMEDVGRPGGVMEAADAERLAADYEASIPLLHVPKYLNCSRVHAQLLSEAGIIKPMGNPGRCRLHSRFMPAELDSFLERLRARATDVEITGDFKDFARCAMKVWVPSPRIVQAVLDGTLSKVALAPGVPGYLGIRVSVSEVKEKLRPD